MDGFIDLGLARRVVDAPLDSDAWDEAAFRQLTPEQRLEHLMTSGVRGAVPHRVTWIVLQIAALALVVGVWLLRSELNDWDPVCGRLFGAPLGIGVALLVPQWVIKAKRASAPYSVDTVLKSQKFPIVFLRPFSSDQHGYGEVPFFVKSTPERKLAQTLTKRLQCPMVAVADPREELGDLGALRVWVTGNWREKVHEFVRCAPVVVLRAASSGQIAWELRQTVALVGSRRLVIEVPLWTPDVFTMLNSILPDVPGRPPVRPAGARFVVFEDDWSPKLLYTEIAVAAHFKPPRAYEIPPAPPPPRV
jgi:hypothetical protein